MQAQAGGVVVVLHLVVAVAQLAAFPAVGLLDGGRKGLRNGVGWGHKGLRVSLRRLAGALGGHRGGCRRGRELELDGGERDGRGGWRRCGAMGEVRNRKAG